MARGNREEVTESGNGGDDGGGVYTDGNSVDNNTAAATITKGEYLGRYATVMDVEMVGVPMG